MIVRTVFVLLCLLFVTSGCDDDTTPVSTSGVKKTSARVETGADGLTVEQQNVVRRLKVDNSVGSIKHLYVISAYSGQVILYSTVQGKITSSGKRLAPTTATRLNAPGIRFDIGNDTYYTQEMLQDDGTYGTSIPYLYWFDTKGEYHQHFPDGGQIIHVSTQPLNVPHIIINVSAEEQK